MASSAATQIEAVAGEDLKLPGTDTPDYATIMGILLGAVMAWTLFWVILGPEADGAHFEEAKVAIQDGAGEAAAADAIRARNRAAAGAVAGKGLQDV